MPLPPEDSDSPYMVTPLPAEQRLADLEARLAEREARTDQNFEAISRTLDLLSRNLLSNQPNPPAHTPATQTASAPTRHKSDLKPALPPAFDGSRHNGKGFINACQAYFRLRPDQFPDEQTKIQWAMTYMSLGRAQKWVNRIYHWELEPKNVGTHYFIDWDDFRSKFRSEFFPLRSDALATNRLEGTGYFQGRRSVDDYLDEFRDLISESGYTDPKTIVVKFRRGLNPAIADAVATMAAGRPDDLDPEAWYDAAIRIDQNQAANAAFRASSRPPFQSSVPTSSATRTAQPPASAVRPLFPPRFAHSAPTPGNPIPMDVDAARRTQNLPPTCYRCGKPGHIKSECKQGFDIRHLDRDDIEVLLEQLSARMDVLNLEAAVPTEPIEPPQQESAEEETSGFPTGSR
jgi:hypothetical protein